MTIQEVQSFIISNNIPNTAELVISPTLDNLKVSMYNDKNKQLILEVNSDRNIEDFNPVNQS